MNISPLYSCLYLSLSLSHRLSVCLSPFPGFALIAFWGRFLLPLPYRIPILGVMGKPIEVTQCDNPSDQEVDRVHAILLEEMVKLFDRHKADYGWGDKTLVIT
jgi:hypothetical protein